MRRHRIRRARNTPLDKGFASSIRAGLSARRPTVNGVTNNFNEADAHASGSLGDGSSQNPDQPVGKLTITVDRERWQQFEYHSLPDSRTAGTDRNTNHIGRRAGSGA